jgi:alkylated DNA repair protein (DNA oxidative demethylase)
MEDALFGDERLDRRAREVLPGAVHVPGWLSLRRQRWIAARFQEWGRGPIAPHSPLVGGHPMSVRMVSLGLAWGPAGWSETAGPEGAAPLPLPGWLVRLSREALRSAFDPRTAPSWPGLDPARLEAWAGGYEPDVALVNYYPPGARMGMHQDRDESSSAPVVSLSIGDAAVFRAGNTQTRSRPYQDLRLASGDLVVFGGPSRFMFHGVPKVIEGSAPRGCGVPRGRINITVRATGRRG